MAGELQAIQAFFTGAFEALPKTEPQWLKNHRADAFAQFQKLGFPTAKTEDWKYLSLSSLGAIELTSTRGGPNNMGTYRGLEIESAARVVIADGMIDESLSQLSLPKGVRIQSLAKVLAEGCPGVETAIAAYPSSDGVKALNNALFRDGVWLEIDAGVVLEKPIHLVISSTRGHAPVIRNIVALGRGAQVRLIEDYIGMGAALTNSATQVTQAAGSILKHLKIQRDAAQAAHFSDVRTHQAKDSVFESLWVSLGAAIARSDVHPTLAEENAECRLLGLYAARDKQQVDNFSVIDHASPHCRSIETYKGILAGEAKGSFTGRIVVRKDAQKTDSQQINRSLLLSDRALANTRPQLQIHADDVKCSHGATVGRLDAEQLFYLRSRGIGLEPAKRLVSRAFAGEVLEQGGWPAEVSACVDRWLEEQNGA